MCIAAAAVPAASLAISAVSTVASIGMGIYSAQQQAAQAQASLNMQAQQAERQQQMAHQQAVLQQQQERQRLTMQQRQQAAQMNLTIANNNAQMQNQYRQQQQQVLNERESIMSRNQAEKVNFQRSKESFEDQVRNNNEAANRVYMGEQAKISEAQKKAAFEQQSLLAKSIGAQGKVLAAGRTGQSVGLLVSDVERQAGFDIAAESAMADSKSEQALLAMDSAFLQAQGQNNQAASRVAYNPTEPYLPKMPDVPNFIDGSDFAIGV